MNRNVLVLVAIVAFVGLFYAATTLYTGQQSEQLTQATQAKSEHIQRDYSPIMGPENAKVTIVEFFDPACGTCAAFYPFVKQLMYDNKGKVNLALRYLPLHQNADEVVKILEASRLQNRFAEVLHRVYMTRDAWIEHHVAKPEVLWTRLGGLDLDLEKLKQDAASEEVARRVAQDMADAKALDVTRTPGFFVNGKPLVSFGYAQLEQLVKSEVSASYSAD